MAVSFEDRIGTDLHLWHGGVQQIDRNGTDNTPLHLAVFPQTVDHLKYVNGAGNQMYRSFAPPRAARNWKDRLKAAVVGDIHWLLMVPPNHVVERVGVHIFPKSVPVDPQSGGPYNNALITGASVRLVARKYAYPAVEGDVGVAVTVDPTVYPLDTRTSSNPLTGIAAPFFNSPTEVTLFGYQIVTMPTNTSPSGALFTWDRVTTAISPYLDFKSYISTLSLN